MEPTSLQQLIKDHIASNDESFSHIDDRFDQLEKKLCPIANAYNGVIFGRQLITGFAAVLIALASIGAAVLWVGEKLK